MLRVIRKPLDLVLAMLALGNLAFGVAASFNAANLADLQTVARWSEEWVSGINPYGSHSATDYPPWALVALSPLALIPSSSLPGLWVTSNLAFASFIAWRLV